MLVVLDTNILVSALMSKNGTPAKIVSLMLTGQLIPCFDFRIINEYIEVLHRPKFDFSDGEINSLMEWIECYGRSVIVDPLDDILIDESDKKFYEVALACSAILITGNLKRYPNHPNIMNAASFLDKWNLRIK